MPSLPLLRDLQSCLWAEGEELKDSACGTLICRAHTRGRTFSKRFYSSAHHVSLNRLSWWQTACSDKALAQVRILHPSKQIKVIYITRSAKIPDLKVIKFYRSTIPANGECVIRNIILYPPFKDVFYEWKSDSDRSHQSQVSHIVPSRRWTKNLLNSFQVIKMHACLCMSALKQRPLRL